MLPIKEEQEEKEEVNNVVDIRDQLKVLPGGRENPPDGNWLSGLPAGTVFLVREIKSANFMLPLFKKLKTETTRSVCVIGPSTGNQPMHVDPIRFCQQFSLFEEIVIDNSEQEEELNEQRDRVQGDLL